ncbi:MAG: hypothetical protein ACRED0_00250 [Gammaproteobacteria bacterium]
MREDRVAGFRSRVLRLRERSWLTLSFLFCRLTLGLTKETDDVFGQHPRGQHHFSKLLEKVPQGEEIYYRQSRPTDCQAAAFTPERRKFAPPGGMEGQGFWIADDFDASTDHLFSCLRNEARE